MHADQTMPTSTNKGVHVHIHTSVRVYKYVCMRVAKRAQVLIPVPEHSRRVCLRSIDSRSVV